MDHDPYYIGKRYAGQQVLLLVDAPAQQFEVWLHNQRLKTCPIRNLLHGLPRCAQPVWSVDSKWTKTHGWVVHGTALL